MSKVRIYGDVSGYVDIAVPDNAGTTTLNLDKIPQADINGNIAMDTNTLYVDAANNRVGVGTASPNTTLDIVSPSSAEAINIRGRSADDIGQLKFYENDGTTSLARLDSRTTHFEVGSYNELRFSAGGVNNSHVVIDTSGNVGIGTDNPGYPLQVNGDLDILNVKGSLGNAFVRFTDGDATADFSIGADDGSGAGAGAFILYDRSNTAYRLVVTSSGNVGIGTATPTEKLHVAGVIRSEGYDTDSITSYNITGSYSAGTEYVFTTRSQLNGLGYGSGFYKFLVWSDTFNAGTSHYQCYTPYDEFYHNNYSSNTSTVQTINYGVSMGHAPNTGTRAIDIRLRHKYGADATYPANQTFTFIPVNGFSNLTGAVGRHLRIYLFKVA